MAQTEAFKDVPPGRRFEGKGTAVTIAAATDTTIAAIPTHGKQLLCFSFNQAVRATDNFEVFGRAHPDAELVLLTPADWTSLPAGGRFLATAVHTISTGAFVDGQLDTVIVGEQGYFEMNVVGLSQVIVKASGTVDDTGTSTPFWTLHDGAAQRHP